MVKCKECDGGFYPSIDLDSNCIAWHDFECYACGGTGFVLPGEQLTIEEHETALDFDDAIVVLLDLEVEFDYDNQHQSFTLGRIGDET